MTGWVHPSINLEDPEEGVDLTRVCAGVPGREVACTVQRALGGETGFHSHAPGPCLPTWTAGAKQQLDVDVALSNSFGFGGHNSCVMFRKWKP